MAFVWAPPQPRTSTPSTRSYRVQILRGAAELEAFDVALRTLGAAALDDNAYAAPAFMGPLLRHRAGEHPLRIALVWKDDELVACAPFAILPPTVRTPLPALSTVVTEHGSPLHPVLHREHVEGALRALWDWIEGSEHPWQLVLLDRVSAASRFWAALAPELARRDAPVWVREVHGRPMLARHASFDAYLATLPSSRRKGYRRRLRALERAGATFHLHRDLSEVPDLAERFMQLEARSWKGTSGTALLASPADRAFFTDAVQRFAGERGLFFVELRIGGVPAAMTANFVAGRTLFAFKVAYDPVFAKYSPGIVTELEGIKRFHEEPDLLVADSGSTAQAYVRAYFRDQAELQWLCIATPRWAARAFVRLMPTVIGIKRTATALVGPEVPEPVRAPSPSWVDAGE